MVIVNQKCLKNQGHAHMRALHQIIVQKQVCTTVNVA